MVFCESREDATRVAEQILPTWLGKRGLSLSTAKTRIVPLREGFDFLGFNVRHYAAPQTSTSGYKLLSKPSQQSVTELRGKLRDAWLRLRGQNVHAVLRRLNPLIRGGANYFRTAVSSAIFHKLDRWMHPRLVRYLKSTHPHQPPSWCVQRYWGKLNPTRNDVWVFGDKRSGRYLLKFSWFPIDRHGLVRGRASPDDPSLREYWWARRKVNIRHLSASDGKLAEAQDWLCRVCGMDLINGEALERHPRKPKGQGGSAAYGNRELVQVYGHQQLTAGCTQWPAEGLCNGTCVVCLSRVRGQLACTVLRGASEGNLTRLPDWSFEKAMQIACHESPRTTKLYYVQTAEMRSDWRNLLIARRCALSDST